MGNNQAHEGHSGVSSSSSSSSSSASFTTPSSSSSSSSYVGSFGFEGDEYERGRRVNFFLREAVGANGSPVNWSETQLRTFVEVCNKNKMLDGSDTGLSLVEIRALLQACQNELIERAEKYIAKKYKKLQKQHSLQPSKPSQASSSHNKRRTSSLRSLFSGTSSNQQTNYAGNTNAEIEIEEYEENNEAQQGQHNNNINNNNINNNNNNNLQRTQLGIEDILIADPELYAIVSGRSHKDRNKSNRMLQEKQSDEYIKNYLKKKYKFGIQYYLYFYQNDLESKKSKKCTITQIVLSRNNMKYIPREICGIFGISSKLTKLDLSNNNIQYLPTSITTLTSLEFLDLSGNKLVCIPKEISELVSLKRLYLNNNKLHCLPFQILSLGRTSLILKAESNPWFVPGQLSNVNNCLRDVRLNETSNNEQGTTDNDELPPPPRISAPPPNLRTGSCPTLVQLCLKAIDKYDICWEAVEEFLPSEIQTLLLIGPKNCDKCQKLLDTTRSQLSLIHFLTVFGCSHPLPFLYSTCSAECSRFILITSCILEFLRRM